VNIPRIRSLRAQVAALEAFREAMYDEMDSQEFDALAKLMIPTTDRILHELAREEQGEDYVPYPHPIGQEWWKTQDPEPS